MTEPTTPGPTLDRIPSPPSESARYPMRSLLPRSVELVERHWRLTGDFPLDQGSEGACVGFGMSAELSAEPVMLPTGTPFAFRLYELARAEDAAMGYHFPSGATVLGGLRAARKLGLVQGFRWATAFVDIRDAVVTHGSVVMGTWWTDGMDSWDEHGLIRATGENRGGHCWTLVGYIPAHPVHGEVFVGINSWGPGWADRGRFLISAADVAKLFADEGEAAIVTDTPQEPEPVPVPAAEPVCASRWGSAFHRPGAHWWILCARTYTGGRAEALAAGLAPCRRCLP